MKQNIHKIAIALIMFCVLIPDTVQAQAGLQSLAYFHAWYNHQVTEALPEGENEWGVLPYEPGNNPWGNEAPDNKD